jgi:hypothetical protein
MRCRFCKHEEKERAAPAAQFGRSDVSFTAFEGDDDEPLGNPSAGEMFRELG